MSIPTFVSGEVLTAAKLNQLGDAIPDLINDVIISGAGAPTTSTTGTVGMLYEDTTNGKLYQCTAASGGTYTWGEIGAGGGGGGIPTDATFWGAAYNSGTNKVSGNLMINNDHLAFNSTDATPLLQRWQTNGIRVNLTSGGTFAIAHGGATLTTINNTAVDVNSHKIVNVTDPTAAQDAATKNYVDTTAPTITMTNTDPGEGSALAANHFIAVYS